MHRIGFLCLAGLLTVAGVAIAEDFWVTKDYMQWTDEEVKRLMTNSPWSKDITITAPLAALGRGQRPVDSSTDTNAETGGGGNRRGRRGSGSAASDGTAGPSEALITINVSWRSALPLRKALVRSRAGAAVTGIPPQAEELIRKDQTDYVIVVSGVPTGLARTIEDPALAEQATIRAGKKHPIAARIMDVQRRTQSVELIYSFPRTQPIALDDKDVEVVLKLGQIEVKKKFSLKDMVYNGKLEL